MLAAMCPVSKLRADITMPDNRAGKEFRKKQKIVAGINRIANCRGVTAVDIHQICNCHEGEKR